VRRQVIFGSHDLINDAPISRVDLLTCRNTLMYLSAETQARVLSRLHFALNEGGFLLLGRAETLMAHGHSFVSVDLKRRLSRKGTRRLTRDQVPVIMDLTVSRDRYSDSRLHRAALEASPVAQLVVNSAGELALANERLRELFGLRRDDVGRPLRDLQLSYRPEELRSLIDRVESERRPLVVKEIEWLGRQGEVRWLDLNIAPLMDRTGSVLGALLTFNDATVHRQLQRELEQSHQELETAYEGLQATNEELETINEELQSTNEELQTLNDELRQREEDLDTSHAFLESVLEQIRPLLRRCMSGESQNQVLTLEAVDLRGETIQCHVTCTPLSSGGNGVRGAILLMEDSTNGRS